jgi:hypothetical protein
MAHLAEFYGGPMHGETRWIPNRQIVVACSVSADGDARVEVGPPLKMPGESVVDYKLILEYASALVLVVRDEKSQPLLAHIHQARSGIIGYTRYQEDLLIERASLQKNFLNDLESASVQFGRFAAAKICHRTKRRRGAA